MAKKYSRQVSKSKDDAIPAAGTSLKPGQRSASRLMEAAAPDFSYVKSDLKRVGLLAGSLFALMIVLYFVLPYLMPLYAR